MRVFDENGVELEAYDESLGYTTPDQRFVQHHDAVEAVAEQSHYEVVKRYPNGGADVKKVVDVPGVKAHEAWDEYEDILVFHPFPQSEEPEENFDEEEFPEDDTPSQLDRIEAQVMYTALMTDTLMEE